MQEKAFPNPHLTHETGMTLRDYFAAMAMPCALKALMHDYDRDDPDWTWKSVDCEMLAEGAYDIADAMMKVRK
jgi:hypothetical protein